MSTPKGTQITDVVVAALQAILTSAGYHTDAGQRVYRGRSPRLEDTAEDSYPAVIVRTLSEEVDEQRTKLIRKTREIEIIALLMADEADYEPELDKLDEDLDLALLALTDPRGALLGIAYQTALSSGTWSGPAEGSQLVYVSHILTVSYTQQI